MAGPLVPVGPAIPPAVAAVLKSHADAISALREPKAPVRLHAVASTDLPPAANWTNCAIVASDLGVIVVSDGSDWIRQDTGAAI